MCRLPRRGQGCCRDCRWNTRPVFRYPRRRRWRSYRLERRRRPRVRTGPGCHRCRPPRSRKSCSFRGPRCAGTRRNRRSRGARIGTPPERCHSPASQFARGQTQRRWPSSLRPTGPPAVPSVRRPAPPVPRCLSCHQESRDQKCSCCLHFPLLSCATGILQAARAPAQDSAPRLASVALSVSICHELYTATVRSSSEEIAPAIVGACAANSRQLRIFSRSSRCNSISLSLVGS